MGAHPRAVGPRDGSDAVARDRLHVVRAARRGAGQRFRGDGPDTDGAVVGRDDEHHRCPARLADRTGLRSNGDRVRPLHGRRSRRHDLARAVRPGSGRRGTRQPDASAARRRCGAHRPRPGAIDLARGYRPTLAGVPAGRARDRDRGRAGRLRDAVGVTVRRSVAHLSVRRAVIDVLGDRATRHRLHRPAVRADRWRLSARCSGCGRARPSERWRSSCWSGSDPSSSSTINRA